MSQKATPLRSRVTGRWASTVRSKPISATQSCVLCPEPIVLILCSKFFYCVPFQSTISVKADLPISSLSTERTRTYGFSKTAQEKTQTILYRVCDRVLSETYTRSGNVTACYIGPISIEANEETTRRTVYPSCQLSGGTEWPLSSLSFGME